MLIHELIQCNYDNMYSVLISNEHIVLNTSTAQDWQFVVCAKTIGPAKNEIETIQTPKRQTSLFRILTYSG